jgi:hypothetical protein
MRPSSSWEVSGDEPTGTNRIPSGVPAGLRPDRRPHHLGDAPGATRPAGLAVTDLHDIEQLQARFNADQGMPRLVLALAPT